MKKKTLDQQTLDDVTAALWSFVVRPILDPVTVLERDQRRHLTEHRGYDTLNMTVLWTIGRFGFLG